jgi:hypothetical protein
VVAGVHTSGWLWMVLGITGYGVLFARTIRENRRNRGVVLGVITVAMFGGFLFLVQLTKSHAAAWLVNSALAVTILTGACVLLLIGLDVARWLRNGRSALDEKRDPSASSLK